MSTAIQLPTDHEAAVMPAAATQPAVEAQIEVFWRAVESRDTRMDGIVYYGVRSTGVYCRPSCPSRRPRRENVDFYFDPDSAERAGLRACLRCKPRQKVAHAADATVRQICAYIRQNLEGTITLKTISAAVGGSPFHLQRVFKQATGITPHEYAEARRMATFKLALRAGNSIADATYEAGFGSSSRLYEQANARLGMTPAAYRKGGAQQDIAYAVAESPIGRVLVAATAKGICRISLGNDDEKLIAGLYGEFTKARISRDTGALREAVGQVMEYLSGERTRFELPTDVRATAFQLRVWKELQKIPYGQTRSYEQIAEKIHRPRATRAVARACASNPVALLVPCHRVVRKDGGMGGYRWGVERKQRLLAKEKGRS